MVYRINIMIYSFYERLRSYLIIMIMNKKDNDNFM